MSCAGLNWWGKKGGNEKYGNIRIYNNVYSYIIDSFKYNNFFFYCIILIFIQEKAFLGFVGK
jgi:hypothetical protein